MIGNEFADKITSTSTELHSEKSKELNSKDLHSNEAKNEITKGRYISSQERQHIFDELRLI